MPLLACAVVLGPIVMVVLGPFESVDGFFAAPDVLPASLDCQNDRRVREGAARIDGASHWEVFWRIIRPRQRPALAAVVILNGVWMWNDFCLGFILPTDPDPDAAGRDHGLPRRYSTG